MVGEADALERPERDFEILAGEARPEIAETLLVAEPSDEHVPQHREAPHQVELLEDHPCLAAHAAEVGALCARDLTAGDNDAARRRTHEEVETAEERRLARAREADRCDELALVYLEIDAPQGLRAAGIDDTEAARAKDGLGYLGLALGVGGAKNAGFTVLMTSRSSL